MTPSSSTVQQPRLGPLGLVRWAWRQLTSMRTALFLLFLLAVAALPGSYFPQRGVDPGRVRDYLDAHPGAGPWLDRVGMFDVYSSPWFASVYLLLLVSLVGCVVPRLRVLARELRGVPPRAPRRLAAMPARTEVVVEATPAEALAVVRAELAARRFRVRPARDGEDAVSAEKGYLREVGNLLFHLALLVVIVGVAIGHLWGWKADVIVPAGSTYTNNLAYVDAAAPGPLVDMTRMDPFVIAVHKVDVDFERTPGKQFGQPRSFTARVTTQDSPTAAKVERTLEVNHPLSFGDTQVFLLGNGYAPRVTVRDAQGKVLLEDTIPFRPQDNNYTSTGAIKVSATPAPKQMGFLGVFMPTVVDAMSNPVSSFPGPVNPTLLLELHEGTLFPGGRPQSVYTLDTTSMTTPKTPSGLPQRIILREGETKQIMGGRGSITFSGLERFAGLEVRHDPGKGVTLAGAVLTLVGLLLSLLVRRHRVFVRATERDGRTLLEVAGLAKGEDLRLDDAVAQLAHDLSARVAEHRPTPTSEAHR